MAEVSFAELVEALKAHPDYVKWKQEVPADQALYIAFDDRGPNSVESEVFETVGGRQVVLDVDKDGRVRGVEIV